MKSLEAAVLLLKEGIETGNKKNMNLAVKIGEFFLNGSLPNGLHQDWYDLKNHKWGGYFGPGVNPEYSNGVNTRCNGEVMYNYLKLYQLLQEQGCENGKFLKIVEKNAQFYIENQLRNDRKGCFGRWWSKDGDSLNTDGTNGTYIISELIELEKITGKSTEIETAILNAAKYYSLLAEKEEYYADTLDADCMDKEAGHAVLHAFLDLYEWRKDKKYLNTAIKAANYILGWTWTYNVIWGAMSPAGKRNIRTRGMTSVSVAHHHLDFYGLIIAYDFLRLWSAGGGEKWRKYAYPMIIASSQLISRKSDDLGWGKQFEGFQPEQLNHTNWDYKHHLLGPRGTYHACAAWTVVLTLGALFGIREKFPEVLTFSLK